MNLEKPVVALQIRSILYDVFGQHMHNLANTSLKDFGSGHAHY